MKKNITLVCKAVLYHSRIDEDMFFEWIDKIPSIINVDGQHDELYLHFKNKRIPADDLRQLIALFYRYKINMKQLAVFLSKSNRKWFYEGEKGYWYDKIFGKQN